jgi:triacylglycerol lipase
MKRIIMIGVAAFALFAAGCSSSSDSAPVDTNIIDRATELMFLSGEAYQMLTDFNEGQTFKLPAPYVLYKQILIDEGGTKVPIAFTASREDIAFLVFRGTVTMQEALFDLELTQDPYTYVNVTDALVETGFMTAYGDIRTELLDALAELVANGFTTLEITGHSLGGALAAVAFPDIAANTSFTEPIIYTFASPRVGNGAFATLFAGLGTSSVRVYNTLDIVPMSPGTEVIVPTLPSIPATFYFYKHVGYEYPIKFGSPFPEPIVIQSLGDLEGLLVNHSHCSYYSTLCAMTDDEATCLAKLNNISGCSF